MTLNGSWQHVEIPLSAFSAQGLDRTRLTGFEVAFEFGTGSGTLWIDNVLLGTAGASQVNRRTLHLQDVDNQVVALHLSDGGIWSAQSDAVWLSATGAESGPGTLLLQTLPWGLPVGTYTGTVVIATDRIDNTTQLERITVYLTVVEPQQAENQIFLPVVSR
ncbi:MAG: hypothetical protein R2867_06325 [Caldilineaceae bacterium]